MEDRLKIGLKMYKDIYNDEIIDKLTSSDAFINVELEEIRNIFTNNMEDVFLMEGNIIISPRQRINAIYVLVQGIIDYIPLPLPKPQYR